MTPFAVSPVGDGAARNSSRYFFGEPANGERNSPRLDCVFGLAGGAVVQLGEAVGVAVSDIAFSVAGREGFGGHGGTTTSDSVSESAEGARGRGGGAGIWFTNSWPEEPPELSALGTGIGIAARTLR